MTSPSRALAHSCPCPLQPCSHSGVGSSCSGHRSLPTTSTPPTTTTTTISNTPPSLSPTTPQAPPTLFNVVKSAAINALQPSWAAWLDTEEGAAYARAAVGRGAESKPSARNQPSARNKIYQSNQSLTTHTLTLGGERGHQDPDVQEESNRDQGRHVHRAGAERRRARVRSRLVARWEVRGRARARPRAEMSAGSVVRRRLAQLPRGRRLARFHSHAHPAGRLSRIGIAVKTA